MEQLNVQSPVANVAGAEADGPPSAAAGSGRSEGEGGAPGQNEPLRKSGESALTNNSKDPKKDDQDAKPQEGQALQEDDKKEGEPEIVEEDDPELKDGTLMFEGDHDLTTGAKLTFTFKEGLVVQI